MRSRLIIFLSLILLLPFFSFATDKSAHQVMYKYTDEKNVTMISHTLPPEVANKGYIILNAHGHEQEVVPPKLSDAAIEQAAIQEKIKAQQAQQQEKQNKENEALLKMFNTVADIQQSKQENVAAIETLENITLENIKHIEEQLRHLQKTALFYTEKKQPIPVALEKKQ